MLTESVGSPRELVANSVYTADAKRQLSRVGVGGVYWALRGRLLWHRGSASQNGNGKGRNEFGPTFKHFTRFMYAYERVVPLYL